MSSTTPPITFAFVPPASATSASATLTGTAATASASAAAQTLSAIIASAQAALATQDAVIHGKAATQDPPVYKLVGILLAVGSGLLIGSSFVWKKKGLISSQQKYSSTAGEGHHYLKSPLWWTGMIIMILGEVCNFAAYMFAPAILVTPLGALSVVICAVLSHFILKESLTLFGSVGCFLCVCGSIIIALNGPEQHASGDIKVFQKMFLSVGFLIWMGVSIITSLVLALLVAPKFGKKNMLVYIGICSLIGGLSVSTTSGLGSAILLSIRGENQFKHWFIYILLAFVVCTLLIEINYLNKALELFNTAMVTPTYYVLFTTCTLISSIVLFQGLQASASAILTIVLGFLVICSGITLLQLSKVDPDDLANKPGVLDRKTTLLLRASQSHITTTNGGLGPGEKGDMLDLEQPGVDTVRGGMGVVGSLLRARSSRRIASTSHADEMGSLPLSSSNRDTDTFGRPYSERFQLYDAPVGGGGGDLRATTMPVRRGSHISFASNTTGGAAASSAAGTGLMYAAASAAGGLSVPALNAGPGGEPQSIIMKDRARSQSGVQQSHQHRQQDQDGAGSGASSMGMRRYGTEPAIKIPLGGIREASAESGAMLMCHDHNHNQGHGHGHGRGAGGSGSGFSALTPASSHNSGLGPEVTMASGRVGSHGGYVDPYARTNDIVALPVLLRGNSGASSTPSPSSPSHVRNIWGGGGSGDDEKTNLAESPTKESASGSGTEAGGRRWGRRGGGGVGQREETGNGSSSEEEEERLLKQQRGTRSP
ncbi:unnamed protein product [Tilletia laevis]|uniref:DUF803-domain-containing protein n=2 Tax=Tilletia TaxID=13289 RepID=A0A177UX08_9BASI|nr:hypothetical protein CF336_g4300 [Tilletia laevis]KAE8261042.1 hypothetical protein A4X03_0g3591 [Tilletia caries]CAD6974591.1 unnamed protein product [Tilletia controversa]KAE8202247.1 hypothetical protein CF335_g3493 [Tilletia laevis]CAD6887432.1 unnamed protein product [Tilletia caries]